MLKITRSGTSTTLTASGRPTLPANDVWSLPPCPKPYPRYARRPLANQNPARPIAKPSRTDDRLFDLCSQPPSATNRRRQPPQVINRRDGSGTLRNRGRPEQGPRTLSRFFFVLSVLVDLGVGIGFFSAVVMTSRLSLEELEYDKERGGVVYGGRGKEESYGRGIGISVPSGHDRTWTEPRGKSYQIPKAKIQHTWPIYLSSSTDSFSTTENHAAQHPQDQDQPHQGPVFPPHRFRPRDHP